MNVLNAVGLSCVCRLMKDPLLNEKSSPVVEERKRERESAKMSLLGFGGVQYKRKMGGRVETG